MSRINTLRAQLDRALKDFNTTQRSIPFQSQELRRLRSQIENQRTKIRLLQAQYDRTRNENLQFRLLEQEALMEDLEQDLKKKEQKVKELREKLATLRRLAEALPAAIASALVEEERAQRERERRERENEARRKRKEEQRKRQRFQTPQASNKPTGKSASKITMTTWRAACDKTFASYASTTVFPAPPVSFICNKEGCKTDGHVLEACGCNLRAAMRSLPELDLRKERAKWHPDRFSGVVEEKREAFKKMAQEIFVVVGAMMTET